MLVLRRPAPKTVPVGNVRIDWTHPLTKGLVAFYLPGVMGPIDLTYGGLDLTFTSVCSQTVYPEGPTLFSDPGTTTPGAHSASIPTNHPIRNWTTLTLYWRGAFESVAPGPIGFSRLIGVEYDNANSSPFASAAIELNSIPTTWGVEWNNAGLNGQTAGIALPTAIGQTFSATAVFQADVVPAPCHYASA